MARDGFPKKGRLHFKTMKGPDANSITSGKRKNRGFKSLEQSSRIHRRALRRLSIAGIFNNKEHKPGEKGLCAVGPNPRRGWMYTAGGALKYH